MDNVGTMDRVELLEIITQCSHSQVKDPLNISHEHLNDNMTLIRGGSLHIIQDALLDEDRSKKHMGQPDVGVLVAAMTAIETIPDEVMLDKIGCISFVRGGIERLHVELNPEHDYFMVFDLNIFQSLLKKHTKENSLSTKAKGWTETVMVVAVGFSLAMAAMGGIRTRD